MPTPPITYLFASALLSSLVTYIIVRFPSWHLAMTGDSATGIQKFHVHLTPRVGGVAIAVAFLATLGIATQLVGATDSQLLAAMLFTASPVFLVGLLEDLTKRVGPAARMGTVACAALVTAWILDVRLTSLDVPFVDVVLEIAIVSTLFTVVAMVGVANAFNIIDGYNGLLGVVSLLILIALGAVAWQVSDATLAFAALALAGGILGFLVWNYPGGRIFAGDGGAYFVGFIVAVLSIALVERHQQVSPWFPLAIVIYPVWETIFSMIRRARRSHPTTHPDRLHLHQLIYWRLCRWQATSQDDRHRLQRNSLTSPYLWLLTALSVVPALLFWNNTIALQIVIVAFIALYVSLYRSIARFRSPKWLVVGDRAAAGVDASQST